VITVVTTEDLEKIRKKINFFLNSIIVKPVSKFETGFYL